MTRSEFDPYIYSTALHKYLLAVAADRGAQGPDADDLVQECLSRVLRRMQDDRLAWPENRDDRHRLIRAYAATIIRNMSIDRARRAMSDAKRSKAWAENQFGHDANHNLDMEELIHVFKGSLNAITPTARAALIRLHLQNRRLADVAEELGMSRIELLKMLRNVRKQIQQDLYSQAPENPLLSFFLNNNSQKRDA